MPKLRSIHLSQCSLAVGVPLVLLTLLATAALAELNQSWMLGLNHHLLSLQEFRSAGPSPSAQWPQAAPPLWLATLWSSFSLLGLGVSALLLLLCSGPHKSPRFAAFLLCLVIVGVCAYTIKRVLGEARPLSVLGAQIATVGLPLYFNSMPSGHATTAFAWAALMLLIPQRETRVAQAVAVLALASAIGLSRIAVGAHWPIDVLAGALLGWMGAMLCIWLAQRLGLTQLCNTPAGWRFQAWTRIGCGLALCWLDSGYPLAQPLQWALGGYSMLAGAWELCATPTPWAQARTRA